MKKPEKKVYCWGCKHEGSKAWQELWLLPEHNGKCGNGFLRVIHSDDYLSTVRYLWFFPQMSKSNALNNCPFYRPTFKTILRNLFRKK